MKRSKCKKYKKLTVTPCRAMQLMCMKMIYYAYYDIKHHKVGSPEYIDAMKFINSEWGKCILMFAKEDFSHKNTYTVNFHEGDTILWH